MIARGGQPTLNELAGTSKCSRAGSQQAGTLINLDREQYCGVEQAQVSALGEKKP